MSKEANFDIVYESKRLVIILDQGPWHTHKTITNDAEGVVERMIETLNGRQLEYIDSDGFRSELLITDNKFVGFGPKEDVPALELHKIPTDYEGLRRACIELIKNKAELAREILELEDRISTFTHDTDKG
jgi:predicted nuclease with TOPRIM domain